jgi:hypothetical protein
MAIDGNGNAHVVRTIQNGGPIRFVLPSQSLARRHLKVGLCCATGPIELKIAYTTRIESSKGSKTFIQAWILLVIAMATATAVTVKVFGTIKASGGHRFHKHNGSILFVQSSFIYVVLRVGLLLAIDVTILVQLFLLESSQALLFQSLLLGTQHVQANEQVGWRHVQAPLRSRIKVIRQEHGNVRQDARGWRWRRRR